MGKPLTYKEFQQYALENYDKGGDAIVECWDENDFNEYVKEFGSITKTKEKEMFRLYLAQWNDIRSTIW